VSEFLHPISETIFRQKYALTPNETWAERTRTIVDYVCGTAGGTLSPLMSKEELRDLEHFIKEFMFLPGGRYIYYAGRGAWFFNNCYIFKSQEDTREDWAKLGYDVMSALMTGGGIGNDYSVYRGEGHVLSRTGGISSGPLPLMYSMNEIGRNVMQGGSRRSALYASLDWDHDDVEKFLVTKNWHDTTLPGTNTTLAQAKEIDFNFPAPLDMTNISVNYDTVWHKDLSDEFSGKANAVFERNVRQAMMTGEPGFSFNMYDNEGETGRNACTDLGSVNMARIDDLETFERVCTLASKFLVCGTIRGHLPTEEIHKVREKNRRLGLGLTGMHEWLLKRSLPYSSSPELAMWLQIYQDYSEKGANEHCDRFYLNRPIAYRAIAPAGTISLLAGATTSGIEPLYAVSYKRRYLSNGTDWNYSYVVDTAAKRIIEETGCDPNRIETAVDLAADPERRIAFQAFVQKYVDMGISSTLNLPAWGNEHNNEDKVEDMAKIIYKYSDQLRGLTFYPDGSRGGQPITSVPYEEAVNNEGVVYNEHESCKGGICGV